MSDNEKTGAGRGAKEFRRLLAYLLAPQIVLPRFWSRSKKPRDCGEIEAAASESSDSSSAASDCSSLFIEPARTLIEIEGNRPTHVRLLKRPRPLPEFDNDRPQGIYAEWKIKGFFFRDDGMLPRAAIRGTCRVQYSTLIVTGCCPKFTVRIPLVSVGFVEKSGSDVLDIRGCSFRLLVSGIENIEAAKDNLRYLVVRQRIPHAILGKKLDWQVKPIRNEKITTISKWSPFNCFRMF